MELTKIAEKMIDELTNLDVHTSVLDKASHGFRKKQIEIALGYFRQQDKDTRHACAVDEMYKIERDIFGFAEAISQDGRFVLVLNPGSERNEENVEKIVRHLNNPTEKLGGEISKEKCTIDHHALMRHGYGRCGKCKKILLGGGNHGYK